MAEMRWEVRGSYWHSWIGCALVGERGWLSEQTWKNVVIKFVSLWGRSCSGSRLNLCAMGQRAIAHNSSPDEQRADLGSVQISAHLLDGQDNRETGGGLSCYFYFFLFFWLVCKETWTSLCTDCFFTPLKNKAAKAWNMLKKYFNEQPKQNKKTLNI